METPLAEIDENDPDVLRFTELHWGRKIPDLTPLKKKRIPPVPATIRTIMSKLPVPQLRRNEHNNINVEIISLTGPSHFYVHLATRKRDFNRIKEHMNKFCIVNL